MSAKIKEEIELLKELINNPDTPSEEKDLYRETIAELEKELEDDKPEPPKKEPKAKPEPKAKTTPKKPTAKVPAPKVPAKPEPKANIKKAVSSSFGLKSKIKDFYIKEYPTDDLGKELNARATFQNVLDSVVKGTNVYEILGVGDSVVRERVFDELSNIKGVDYEVIYDAWLNQGALTEEEIFSGKTKNKKAPAKPKPLPVDAEKMKSEIKDRTGKTEEECEQIIAEYRKLREKAKRVKAKRLDKLDAEGKLIDGTNVKNAAAVIESTAKDVKEKIEKQVEGIEKEANKGNRTPEQIEARINRNLDKLSKEMTKQATTFIKGIQSELAKADKTEAKQFLLNVREEIDELLSKFAGGGSVEGKKGYILEVYFGDSEPYYLSSPELGLNNDDAFSTLAENAVILSFSDANNFKKDILSNNEFHSPEVKLIKIDEEFGSGGVVYRGGREYPTGSAWSKEHYNYDKSDKRETPLSQRKQKKKFERGGSVSSDINQYKKQLIQKAKKKGLYENFGQDEVRKLEDKYGYTREVESFDNWAMNFDLEQLKRYDSGGVVQTYNITQSNMSASSVNPGLFELGGDVPSFKKRFSNEEFQYRLNLAKSQIINDVKSGVVDASKVDDFRDLHDFVDANYYGGFVEYDYKHSKEFRFENKVQDALNKWIVSGGLNEALPAKFKKYSKGDFDVIGYSVFKNGKKIGSFYYDTEDDAFWMSTKNKGQLGFDSREDILDYVYSNPNEDLDLELMATGGSIESEIANTDARIANLRELRAVSSPEQQERLDNQIANIEREKQRMLMGDAAPRKKLFGLF